MFYILCKYLTVHPVWEKYFGVDSVMLASHARFDSVVWGLMLQSDTTIFIHILIVFWGLWKFRNLTLFQQTKLSVYAIVDNCFAYVDNYKLIWNYRKVHKNLTALRWHPPPCEMWKLNFDGAGFYSLNQSGVAAILQNDKRGYSYGAFSKGRGDL